MGGRSIYANLYMNEAYCTGTWCTGLLDHYTPHPEIPDSIAHSKTHTDIYHANVFTTLMRVDVPGATKEDIIEVLRGIAEDLEDGVFPLEKAIKI